MTIVTFLLQYMEGGGCPLARHSRRTLEPLRTVMLPFRGCRLWIFGGTENNNDDGGDGDEGDEGDEGGGDGDDDGDATDDEDNGIYY